MRKYTIAYKMYSSDSVHHLYIHEKNKENAYDIAVFERIKELEDSTPYCAWVESVMYQNGKIQYFNNFEGKPY